MQVAEPVEQLELCDEAVEVVRRRYREARAAGLTIAEAKLFADLGCERHADVGLLRTLVAGGATPELIARILI